jgi:hypothetical protein
LNVSAVACSLRILKQASTTWPQPKGRKDRKRPNRQTQTAKTKPNLASKHDSCPFQQTRMGQWHKKMAVGSKHSLRKSLLAWLRRGVLDGGDSKKGQRQSAALFFIWEEC